MSSLDKSVTNAMYEIEIDPETVLPVRIHVTVLTGRRGTTEMEGKKITGGEHVAFHFEYRLEKFGELDRLEIPSDARRLLARR